MHALYVRLRNTYERIHEINKTMNKTRSLYLAFIIGGVMSQYSSAADKSPQTDWLKDARIGAFMHYLPRNAEQFAKVNDFDVEALAKQLGEYGCQIFRANPRPELWLL